MADPRDLLATLYFLRRDDLYFKVKPYNLEYASADLPISNLKTHKVEQLPITDLRGIEHKFTFDKNGFAVLDLESTMTYEDFDDAEKVETTYCHELGLCLLKYMNATSVQVFDAQIRRRHHSFPYSAIDPEVRNQPAVRAHVDATPDAIKSVIQFLNKEEAAPLLKGRYIYVNIWKPLKGPVQDWPLALCDAASVDPNEDLVAHDTVFAETVRENMMVHFNPRQRWHYLSDQLPSELLVFRQVDSELKPAVPHASFINPTLSNAQTLARESIEARAIVYFGD